MCIYCLYLCRRQKSLNHSAIHLTCLYMSSSCVINRHVYAICCQLVCLPIMYVYCMYLSWRHGRTTPWPSCLSRLKNLIHKKIKKIIIARDFISPPIPSYLSSGVNQFVIRISHCRARRRCSLRDTLSSLYKWDQDAGNEWQRMGDCWLHATSTTQAIFMTNISDYSTKKHCIRV